MFGSKSSVTSAQVLDALKGVIDPDLHRNIVELGFVKNLEIDGSKVKFDVDLTTPACPVKEQLKEECERRVAALPGVKAVAVTMTATTTGRAFAGKVAMSGVRNVLAVASGKGGVGKSTTAVNLALALRERGAKVGLLDADVYGPSIPMMLGVQKRPQMTPEKKILPVVAHGLATMSMGYLSDDNTPVIWRGPMVSGLIQQFLGVVEWGELDYLVIDLPPGTGDIQLTLCQQAPLAGAIIVTTPQDVSLLDARKGLKMFEQVNVPVLGLVENMSFFICGHCHQRTEIFRHGGGQGESVRLGVPFLGEIPLDPEVVLGGDSGQPILLRNPKSAVAEAYRKVAGAMAAQLSIANAQAPAQNNVKLFWNAGSAAAGGGAAPGGGPKPSGHDHDHDHGHSHDSGHQHGPGCSHGH
ncbi:MAG: iron-sulfur cluster carrier protein ApbC [Planctomycetes bacterium]|nr:iron-sulfur cluster carrier protein ApbC [Planctomycetota bacterium]